MLDPASMRSTAEYLCYVGWRSGSFLLRIARNQGSFLIQPDGLRGCSRNDRAKMFAET